MINKAQLMGRVGKKDHRFTQNGKEMTMISMATSRKWMDSQGQQQENTTWHNVHFFNKLADITNKYLNIGDLVYVEGEIQNKKVMIDNSEKWMYSVTANEVKLLPQAKRELNGSAGLHSPLNEEGDLPF